MYAEVTSIHVSQMTSFNMLGWLVAEAKFSPIKMFTKHNISV